MANLILRAAEPTDADSIGRMLAELGYAALPEDVVGRLATVRQEGGTVIIAEDAQQRALGLISLTRHAVLHAPGPVAQITALVITAEARRRGVGRALVAAAHDWAEGQCCVRLTVTSAEHRADAHAFYPACGLPYTGRRYSVSTVRKAPV